MKNNQNTNLLVLMLILAITLFGSGFFIYHSSMTELTRFKGLLQEEQKQRLAMELEAKRFKESLSSVRTELDSSNKELSGAVETFKSALLAQKEDNEAAQKKFETFQEQMSNWQKEYIGNVYNLDTSIKIFQTQFDAFVETQGKGVDNLDARFKTFEDKIDQKLQESNKEAVRRAEAAVEAALEKREKSFSSLRSPFFPTR